jgi:dUTP pyrophosphatase
MFENFNLKIKLNSPEIKAPSRAHDTDAGIDVYSPESVTIPPNGDCKINLQLKTEFTPGFALIFKEKSGVATKKKLVLGACVVDSSYRGDLIVHLINTSTSEVTIEKGDKITQFVVVPVWSGQPEIVQEIDENTERGAGGFGSTGNK